MHTSVQRGRCGRLLPLKTIGRCPLAGPDPPSAPCWRPWWACWRSALEMTAVVCGRQPTVAFGSHVDRYGPEARDCPRHGRSPATMRQSQPESSCPKAAVATITQLNDFHNW